MEDIKREKALEKMENYENSMVIHNYFDEDTMTDFFQDQLLEYSEQMAREEGGDWNNFKQMVEDGDINWTHSGHDYKIYLQESVDIDVITKIRKSFYGGSISIDLSEWDEKHQEMMIIDAMWKVYNYGRSFDTYRNIKDIYKSLELLRGLSFNSLFKETSVEEIKSFIKGMDNFDEKQISFWLKLK
jgi:hypothetical protein